MGRALSVFDLLKVSIGPSSSHTAGPMRAAAEFSADLDAAGVLEDVATIEVSLYGSLAATGPGHGTLDAVLLGFEGCRPDQLLPSEAEARQARISDEGTVLVADRHSVPLSTAAISLHPLTRLQRHSNGMRFTALDATGEPVQQETFFSIGGGFIARDVDGGPDGEGAGGDGAIQGGEGDGEAREPAIPMPFSTAVELLEHCRRREIGVSEVMLRNELTWRTEAEIRQGLLHLRDVMFESVAASVAREGYLPGRLSVRRRAKIWYDRLQSEALGDDPTYWQEWVNMVALAVNEENASGGRVVTAPTNGAAGIIPAVLHYALHYPPAAERRDEIAVDFLLAAGAIGVLFKEQASLSGAEVGCQGEVGSAASMAAGGLASVLGGTPEQVENAAEIAMEHNLGLTCDPIGGLVQVPCIERNALAATQAINAARMALWGDGQHHVSLDEVIVTMRETGRDMSEKYKETSQGGLAVNVIEC
ncbi:L-serine ammonia-lyase [Bogoriella caseilytica]|uniref:L-serine dehydratase n=1 Tax=Bogoriella caseilytica TaxID=56055 RepID=A0A3N2BC51_9MICO|nr:L-serine ammonia-lyase [Bogoriella caseilytica]ROR72815.1 L-serine dehydratase [Bogoriella caseilytica]